MSNDHLYTYGITADAEDGLDIDVEGVEGATRAYAVEYRTLSAIVTDIDTLEPERSDENVRAHDDVLQEALYHDGGMTVVPMQFGMVFKDARTLKNVLRSGRQAFTRALNDVEGTVEFGIKLVAEEGSEFDREAVTTDISERLAPKSVGEAENDLYSDRLVMNRSYLVDQEERAAFDEAVDAVIDEYGETFTVQYTGPYAPYSFVDIKVGAQR